MWSQGPQQKDLSRDSQWRRKKLPPKEATIKAWVSGGGNGDNNNDNNGCISACTAPKMTPRTKHIAVKCHFVRNCFNMDPTVNRPAKHPFILEKIETDRQKADLFTKGFNEEKFVILRKLLCGWQMILGCVPLGISLSTWQCQWEGEERCHGNMRWWWCHNDIRSSWFRLLLSVCVSHGIKTRNSNCQKTRWLRKSHWKHCLIHWGMKERCVNQNTWMTMWAMQSLFQSWNKTVNLFWWFGSLQTRLENENGKSSQF